MKKLIQGELMSKGHGMIGKIRMKKVEEIVWENEKIECQIYLNAFYLFNLLFFFIFLFL